MIAVPSVDELDFGCCEIRSGAYYIELLELDTRLAGRSQVRISDQDIVKAKGDIFLLETDAAGGIPLGISID
jgi:hypothetical protein